MNKTICILLIILVLFSGFFSGLLSGCGGINQLGKLKNGEDTAENIDITMPDPAEIVKIPENITIEQNINAEDLAEDMELTELAKEHNITEENTGEQIDTNNKKDNENEEEIIIAFEAAIPAEIVQNIKYDKYKVYNNYLLILTGSANIREKPSTEAGVSGKIGYMEKIELAAEVKGQYIDKYQSDSWYKVRWIENGEVRYGYISSKLAEPREFQFDKMYQEIVSLKSVIDKNTTAYITNYKNSKGTAPLHKGRTSDDYGIGRHQSAPAYLSASTKANFRYIQDGVLVNIIGKTEAFYKITTSSFEGEYYVPKKYVSLSNSIKALEKVVVVDRKNQNEAVFEYVDDNWSIVSYIYATTGENAKYKLPTDLGYYMAIETRERFLYLDDETGEVAGYAPYAVRFSGGTYIHGVPVVFQKQGDKLVDPGIIEYLFTIGTTPRSHKCVRNYTSHAEFIYKWVEIGKTAIIVIE